VRRQALVAGGQRLRITTSVGLALFDGSAAEGEDLLADADLAMYEAKESGRDRYAVYTQERQAHAQARFTWAERIRRALERDLFVLHAQPILNVAEGRVSQYELLLRMQDGVGGLPRPGAFLPTAERFGLITEIDRWVVKNAINLIASHRAAGNSLRLEVNLSAKSLGDDQLPQLIEHELAATSIDPASLILEITETAAISNMEEARDFAERLVALGCRFALDDFGAGFGSFFYLKYLPIDLLKIDGDFIHSLASSVTDQLVVKAIVSIAHGLGVKTVAEFVGDDDTLDLLRSYGVDYAQGFHVGRPRPASELLDDSNGELTRRGPQVAAPSRPAP
jgi:EAL domain-containing protein (putative c-di-GMP-specific phosphodiesterase class I)